MIINNLEILKISQQCLSRWGKEDMKTENFHIKISKWLEPIDDEYEESILIKLLKNFNYYTRYRISEILIDLHSSYMNEEKNDDYSIYTSIKSKNGHVNSSQELIIDYKNINNINSKSVIDDLKSIINRDKSVCSMIKCVVFVDDVIGTGKTVIDYLKGFIEFLKGKKVFLLVLEVSEFGYYKVLEFGKQNGINIKIKYFNMHKKAFLQDYIFDKDNALKARTIVEKRETLLWNNKLDYVLGFKESELLLAFCSNTPNNTLSSFWYKNEELNWNPLFPRKNDPNPKWEKSNFKKLKEKNDNINRNLYNNKIAKKGL